MAGPLAGIRVADFSWVWAGPFCTMQLAHMGAEVVRIESMRRVCALRMLPPWLDGRPGVNRSGYFNQYNQGKRSVTLDISTSEGADIAKRIVAISDIAVENFAAGVLERLGLGYGELKKVKPDLIMISMSGYGATGPESHYVSYGPAQVPLSGMSSLTGYAGWPPMHAGMSYGDPNAGLHAAFAVLAALLHRERSGEGQHIDMSQWESTMALIGDAFLGYGMNGNQPPRDGSRVPHMAPHGIFPCAGAQTAEGLPDDRWLSIACGSDEEWRALCKVMGRPELADDPRFHTLVDRKANEDALEAAVSEWTQTQDPFEATHRLQAAGVAAFPPLMNRELAEDPHLNTRGFFVEKEHPEVGVRKHAGIPWRMSETPCEVWRAAPTMGQDNEYVFGELLRMSRHQIAELVERKAIF
ncbi:MAG TPA: CoA transferase [Dehalococcoidia bacterium]|nr:CoA transferase [Dehalococcoidia bacterium]